MQEYIEEAESALLHTYNRYQIVFDRGEGVYLYDIEGKKYLDFVAGIAVFAFGYHNEEYNDALKAQIDKLIHTSNYYYNVPAVNAARKLKEAGAHPHRKNAEAGRAGAEAAAGRIGGMEETGQRAGTDSIDKTDHTDQTETDREAFRQ